MPYDIRTVSTYPPRKCGIATFSQALVGALGYFREEVAQVRVAAIDNRNAAYQSPVDMVIDQYDPASWSRANAAICEAAAQSAGDAIIILQHEYGLDPDRRRHDDRGINFVRMAKAFRNCGLTTLVYLHTVLDNPNTYQKRILQELARYSDGLIVTTESAIDILESKTYGINHTKLKHIDHGIRMQRRSQYDRLAIKQEYGMDNHFLVTTLGFLSPDKGIHYGIRAYGGFLEQSCTGSQREKLIYLIGGRYHPEFVKTDGGRPCRQYQTLLVRTLKKSNLQWCTVSRLASANFNHYDVVFLDTYLDESTLLKLYGATNAMVLPYLNMRQISSSILADTMGSGRVAVATKFTYAVELIAAQRRCPGGLVLNRHARGILVDPGEPSVEQIAQPLDYLVFNKAERLRMEGRAQQRGYQMRWNNTAWSLLQYIGFVEEEKRIITGRGIDFARKNPSTLQDGW